MLTKEFDETSPSYKRIGEAIESLRAALSSDHSVEDEGSNNYDVGAKILHVANYFNEYFEPAEILKKLCETFSDYDEINARNMFDETPLLKLVHNDNVAFNALRLECIYTLIRAEADLHAEDLLGNSFMDFINDENYLNEDSFKNEICEGQNSIDKLLFIDILHTLVDDLQSCDVEILIAAFGEDKNKIAKALVNGANIEAKTKRGYTPFMLSSMFGTPETVKFLINKGADINVKDKYGNNVIALAVNSPHNNCENIRVLSEVGADLNSKNNDGSIPIKQATTSTRRN
ncbi:MAG: ankyrin repeat domain-containing protein [Synergistaceae bacterium]|nr:ankyrin repeat domain-containing protein [Synergistaceae bacterium]